MTLQVTINLPDDISALDAAAYMVRTVRGYREGERHGSFGVGLRLASWSAIGACPSYPPLDDPTLLREDWWDTDLPADAIKELEKLSDEEVRRAMTDAIPESTFYSMLDSARSDATVALLRGLGRDENGVVIEVEATS